MQGPLAPDNETDILGNKEEFKNQQDADWYANILHNQSRMV